MFDDISSRPGGSHLAIKAGTIFHIMIRIFRTIFGLIVTLVLGENIQAAADFGYVNSVA